MTFGVLLLREGISFYSCRRNIGVLLLREGISFNSCRRNILPFIIIIILDLWTLRKITVWVRDFRREWSYLCLWLFNLNLEHFFIDKTWKECIMYVYVLEIFQDV
jgi:hypothetical protein